jgi:hypothetical protein
MVWYISFLAPRRGEGTGGKGLLWINGVRPEYQHQTQLDTVNILFRKRVKTDTGHREGRRGRETYLTPIRRFNSSSIPRQFKNFSSQPNRLTFELIK